MFANAPWALSWRRTTSNPAALGTLPPEPDEETSLILSIYVKLKCYHHHNFDLYQIIF